MSSDIRDQSENMEDQNKFLVVKITEKKIMNMLNDKLRDYIEYVEVTEKENRILKREILNIQKELNKYKEEYLNSNLAALNSNKNLADASASLVKDLRSQLEVYYEKYVELEVRRDSLILDMDILKDKLRAKSKENDKLEKQILALQKNLHDMSLEKQKLRAEVRHHKETNKAMKNKYDENWMKSIEIDLKFQLLKTDFENEICKYKMLLTAAHFRKNALKEKLLTVNAEESSSSSGLGDLAWKIKNQVKHFLKVKDLLHSRSYHNSCIHCAKVIEKDVENKLYTDRSDDPIISILSNRNRSQRLEVVEVYEDKYQESLDEEFERNLSGNFKMACQYLIWKESEIDPRAVRKAVKGLGTDEASLIEVLCTKNSVAMMEIAENYSLIFHGRSMLKDVQSDTSWGLKKFLTSLIENRTPDAEPVDETKGLEDAQILLELDTKLWTAYDVTFLDIFTTRSFEHLSYVFKVAWPKITEESLIDVVEERCKREIKQCVKTIVQFVLWNRSTYYATQIHEALTAKHVEDKRLAYLVLPRDKTELKNIAAEYKNVYKIEIQETIEETLSGSHQHLMVSLFNNAAE